jgi:hypothetical protein
MHGIRATAYSEISLVPTETFEIERSVILYNPLQIAAGLPAEDDSQ